MTKLLTETNTPAVEKKVLAAARKHFNQRKNIGVFFEHGQWWVLRENKIRFSETYSASDAEGFGTTNGFIFHLV